MSSAGNFTLFRTSGQSAGSSGDYDKSVFLDVSVDASNNTGFTSTSLTNPLSANFNDTDSPQYGAKTLWIKDLILLTDHTTWINNKPTYQIIFNESWPNAYAYAYGDIRIRNTPFGRSISVNTIDDGIGVTGNFRRVQFLLNPTTGTGTADIVVDGADTGNDVTFSSLGSSCATPDINKYSAFRHAATDETDNLHDYRLTANENSDLSLAGFVVHYTNGTGTINLRPGSTYVNKDKKTTSTVNTQSLATISGRLGGRTVIYKTSTNTYSSTTVEPPSLSTIGVGSSGTNAIVVTTGHGASFPVGTGVITTGGAGSSFYVGSVLSVSTDTLTVGPTLSTYGTSGTLYKAWYSGSTAVIGASLYQLAYVFDAASAVQGVTTVSGFAQGVTGNFYYSDPYKRYRASGWSLSVQNVAGYVGVGTSVGAGFFQVDGNFQAAEFEFAAPNAGAVLHGTLSVNGCPGWGINEGASGYFKKTIFKDAGPAWNSFVWGFGASCQNVVISRVNFYQLALGNTLGNLAYYDTFQNQASRTAYNATMMQIGLKHRTYADEIFATGPWNRGVTVTAPGGVFYFGNTTTLGFNYQWYGKNFGLIGVAGGSGTISIDGAAAQGASFNVMNSVATLGFHTVSYTHYAGTVLIAAIDVADTMGELVNVQNFLPREELDDSPKIYETNKTPQNPNPGSIWLKNPYTLDAYMFLNKKWNKVVMNGSSDDPNALDIFQYPSEVFVHTGNGFGSVSTKIRRFTTVVYSRGVDIVYTDSSTTGAAFTIQNPGIYVVFYQDLSTGTDEYGISLNTTQPTIDIDSVNFPDRVAVFFNSNASQTATCSTVLALKTGDVIRPHTNGNANSSSGNLVTFYMKRIL